MSKKESNEIAVLHDEIRRLREALEDINRKDTYSECSCGPCADVARSALRYVTVDLPAPPPSASGYAVLYNGRFYGGTEFVGPKVTELKRRACRHWAPNAMTRPRKENVDVWPRLSEKFPLTIVPVRVVALPEKVE